MMRPMLKPKPTRIRIGVSRVWITLTFLGLIGLLAAGPALGQVGREYRIELIIFAHNGPEARDYMETFAHPVEPRLGRFGIGEGPISPSLEEFDLETVAEQIERSGAGTVIERLVWEQVGRDFHRTPWIRVQAGRYLGLREPHSEDFLRNQAIPGSGPGSSPGVFSDPFSTPYPELYPDAYSALDPENPADPANSDATDAFPAFTDVDADLPADPWAGTQTGFRSGSGSSSGLALLGPEDERYELEGRLRVWVGRFLHLETDLVRYSVEAALQSQAPPPGILVRGRQRMNSGEDLFYLDHPNVGMIARVTRIETDH